MSLEDIITPKIQKIVEQSGTSTLFIISFLLFFNYFGVFDISRLGVAKVDLYLWIYLIFNIVGANTFKYINNRNNPVCPKCQKKLLELTEYECPDCGKIKYEK